jgi:hypothetical protein
VAAGVAFDTVVKQALYLIKVIVQLKLQDRPTTILIYTDSDNAIAIMIKDSFCKAAK